MVPVQLDFFKTAEECEIDALRLEVAKIRESSDRVRKGAYARLNELGKECADLKMRLEIIERNICHGIKE
jgi:hypothetical protein